MSDDILTPAMPDFGAEPPRRGLWARLRGKGAAGSDAFGAATAEDPFAFADDDARFRRRRRIFGAVLVLIAIGVGAGAWAYLHFAPEPEEAAPASTGNRVVMPMPPEPGPENLARALIAPPGAAEAPEAVRPAPSQTPAVKPAPVPSVALPVEPSPRLDRDSASKPPRYADLPRTAPPVMPPLASAPIAELQRRTPGGLTVPSVGADGRRPWQAYARPFTADAKTPRIAVIVTGLGLSQEATGAAIEGLPPDVTLAFDATAPQLPERLAAARRAGHEAMLEIGLQRETFPAADPGPEGLLAVLSPEENAARLERALARGSVYVGVLARGGDAYAASPPHAGALMTALKRAGLAFVSAVPFSGVEAYPARAGVDVAIPAATFRERISAQLRQAETTAKTRGSAVVVVDVSPLALAQITPWLGGLPAKGVAVAPVSAVVKE